MPSYIRQCRHSIPQDYRKTDNGIGSPRSVFLNGAGLAVSLALAPGGSATQTPDRRADRDIQPASRSPPRSSRRTKPTRSVQRLPAAGSGPHTCNTPAAAIAATPPKNNRLAIFMSTSSRPRAQFGCPARQSLRPARTMLSRNRSKPVGASTRARLECVIAFANQLSNERKRPQGVTMASPSARPKPARWIPWHSRRRCW